MSRGGSDGNVTIIVKKIKKVDGHHGGSWKVAYADFVTAMMAFFMVMWIVGMESDVKELVQGYFNNPIGYRRAFGAGMDPLSQGSEPLPNDLMRMPRFVRQVEERRFGAVRDEILHRIKGLAGADEFESQIEVVLTPDGLRIELREGSDGGTFFTIGGDGVNPATRNALRVVAESIEGLPNHVVIEGHTDSANYGSDSYTNWELSVDRANAARRVLLESGLDRDRVVEVRGYADRQPLDPTRPLDPSNRRVSILIPYMQQVDSGDGAGPLDGGVPGSGGRP
jgi:chemotaxis protein MotB